MTEFVPGGGDDELTIPPDTYAEADEFTTWPVGYSIMAVTSGANWGPNSGEAGIVTTKSAGTEGVQTLETYAGSTYKRAYTDDEWSEWAEVGGGVAGIVGLEADSRLYADPPSAYPMGFSIMAAEDSNIEGSFGEQWDLSMYVIYRWNDGNERAVQVEVSRSNGYEKHRGWDWTTSQWTSFVGYSLTSHNHNSLYYTKAEIDAMLA